MTSDKGGIGGNFHNVDFHPKSQFWDDDTNQSLIENIFHLLPSIDFSSVPAEKLLAATNLRLLSPGFFWCSTSSLRKCFTRQMFLDVSLNSSYLSDLVSESESQIVIVWILL